MTKIRKISYSEVPDSQYYLAQLSSKLGTLFQEAFMPEVLDLNSRLKNFNKLIEYLKTNEFLEMMSEEILNALSNVIEDKMQIDKATEGVLKNYIKTEMIPYMVEILIKSVRG